jgi:toxin ParE1/3/4
MAKATFTPEARQDLKDIAIWIGRKDRRPKVAARIVRQIKADCDKYASAFARGWELGTARPELAADYRVFSFKRWVIIFRPIADGIDVMRIVDGSRDFDRVFGTSPDSG